MVFCYQICPVVCVSANQWSELFAWCWTGLATVCLEGEVKFFLQDATPPSLLDVRPSLSLTMCVCELCLCTFSATGNRWNEGWGWLTKYNRWMVQILGGSKPWRQKSIGSTALIRRNGILERRCWFILLLVTVQAFHVSAKETMVIVNTEYIKPYSLPKPIFLLKTIKSDVFWENWRREKRLQDQDPSLLPWGRSHSSTAWREKGNLPCRVN